MRTAIKILLVLMVYLGLVACQASIPEANPVTPAKDSVALSNDVSYDSTMFEDAITRENKRYEKVFAAILDTAWYQDSARFLQKLDNAYGLLNTKGKISKFERALLFGYTDTIYSVEYSIPIDSICENKPHQQQFLFNRDGQLLHQDQATSAQFIEIWEDQAPVLMTLNISCEGKGKHHFYKYENGRLIDIFNVFLGDEQTPYTYLNIADSVCFDPLELKLIIKDLNNDDYNDLLFSGKKIVLKDETGRKYPTWKPYQKELIVYKFIYKPAKGLFFLEP